ncbi:hypothetical protein Tco_0827118 [Tanacetum coccineum]
MCSCGRDWLIIYVRLVEFFATPCNIARFNRDQKNGNKYKTANQKKHEGRKNTFYDPSKEAGTFDSRNSFVNVLKGTNMVKETDSSPVIVLGDDV